MYGKIQQELTDELAQLRQEGLYKQERILSSPQGVTIQVQGKKVINFCANNYLGLANDPVVVKKAQVSVERWGYGLASVRFICGTQEVHKELEGSLSAFLKTEDTILYSSCFDANAGVFETLFGETDVIISDRLNHASIIDGVRLSKAQRLVYEHLDMADLEIKLQSATTARRIVIVTDGVFSMDGHIAPLDKICELAEKYQALVMVDDSHATGILGPHGRGTPELFGVQERIDILTSTLGKALGGASGGFTSGRSEIIEFLRQRSRPYLFSNSLAPAIAATSLAIIQSLSQDETARQQLWKNTDYFRTGITHLGLTVRPGTHPIVPVMLGDAKIAQAMASRLLELGIYVISFSFPVVPRDQARIRVQLSAAHTQDQLDQALSSFGQVARELNLIQAQ